MAPKTIINGPTQLVFLDIKLQGIDFKLVSTSHFHSVNVSDVDLGMSMSLEHSLTKIIERKKIVYFISKKHIK